MPVVPCIFCSCVLRAVRARYGVGSLQLIVLYTSTCISYSYFIHTCNNLEDSSVSFLLLLLVLLLLWLGLDATKYKHTRTDATRIYVLMNVKYALRPHSLSSLYLYTDVLKYYTRRGDS